MIIYKITNKINGKIYIGQTIREIKHRWAQHCSKKEGCLAIYRAIQKYGKENFAIEKIDTASSLEELNKKETEHILSHNSLSPNGYNLNTGSGNKRWSEESKKRMSLSHSGKTLSEQHKENISDAVRKVFEKNPEKLNGSRAAFAEIRKKWSEEGYHPKRGKKLSEESRKRISKAKIGKKILCLGKH